MKKKNFVIGLVVLVIVAFGGWKHYKSTISIDIGHPQKGDFVKVGEMTVPRYNHESILLDDGTVLVFGGMTLSKNYEGGSYTADIYDPKTKKFTPVGSMLEHRENFAFTKLNNGKVLITGGRVSNAYSKSTELYNPNTKVFEKGSDMRIRRVDHSATLLKNGKVLIAGGGFRFANESEIYNPKTNKFELAPKMNVSRFIHSAILLKDGRVLVVGGAQKGSKLKSAEVYDPKKNQFKLVGNMNVERTQPNLYLLKNGNVVITEPFQKKIEMYNPKTNKFKIIAQYTSEAEMPAETLLNDDKVLFTGGAKGVGLGSWWYKSSEIFDPKTGKFTQGKDMNFLRSCHKATLLKDGNVLITGSYNKGTTAELYISK